MAYTITNIFLHDTSLFTEGLFFRGNTLLESTGSPEELPATKSMAGISDLRTGKFEKKIEIDRNKFFGEGIAVLNKKLYQLTYLNQTGFIYDVNTYQKLGEFKFDSKEGWGLTHDSIHLIMSDGTNIITYIDTATLQAVKRIQVTDNNAPVNNLNELEYVNGYIYANVFTTNTIVKINPLSGLVVAKVDCTALFNEAQKKFPGLMEMNGIAYNPLNNRFYITGKFWPTVYEISLN